MVEREENEAQLDSSQVLYHDHSPDFARVNDASLPLLSSVVRGSRNSGG